MAFVSIFDSVTEQNALLNVVKAPGGDAMSEGGDRCVTRVEQRVEIVGLEEESKGPEM